MTAHDQLVAAWQGGRYVALDLRAVHAGKLRAFRRPPVYGCCPVPESCFNVYGSRIIPGPVSLGLLAAGEPADWPQAARE